VDDSTLFGAAGSKWVTTSKADQFQHTA